MAARGFGLLTRPHKPDYLRLALFQLRGLPGLAYQPVKKFLYGVNVAGLVPGLSVTGTSTADGTSSITPGATISSIDAVNGTITLSGTVIASDFCTGPNQITEYSCVGSIYTYHELTCPYPQACQAGRCGVFAYTPPG